MLAVNTLGDIIERNERLFGDRPALVFGDRRFTHAQYAARVRKLTSALARASLHRGDRFSVLAMNCSEFVESYGAAEWAGFMIHTVNYRLAVPEIVWSLNDAAPRVLIFEAQYTEVIAALREQVPGIETYVCIGPAPEWAENYEVFLEAGDGGGAPFRARNEDYFCLMYTSGTTGKPKGVVHTQASALRVAEVLSSELSLGPECRLLAVAPVFHMGARTLYQAAMFRGGCAVLHRSFDPEQINRVIEDERITAVHLVPTMVQAILDAPNFGRHDRSSLKMLMYAAAPMPVPLLRRAIEAFGPVTYNCYGQTEINALTFLHPHQHVIEGESAAASRRLASVGQPHWQCAIRIIDDADVDLEPGQIGEVLARSETAMAGYWNNTLATVDTMRDGWVRTGDLGFVDEQGFLFLVDRKKDLIISGGENVYSREVEEAILLHPAVQEVAVIGVPDPRWGEAVKAIVVSKPAHHVDSQELIIFCKMRIASYKCPKTIELTEELPKLNTGKINKLELRRRYSP